MLSAPLPHLHVDMPPHLARHSHPPSSSFRLLHALMHACAHALASLIYLLTCLLILLVILVYTALCVRARMQPTLVAVLGHRVVAVAAFCCCCCSSSTRCHASSYCSSFSSSFLFIPQLLQQSVAAITAAVAALILLYVPMPPHLARHSHLPSSSFLLFRPHALVVACGLMHS